MEEARAVAEALRLLEIDQLVLSLQDVSFPAGEGDLGRGSPYSAGARRFLAFVRAYLERLTARPSVQKVLEQAAPFAHWFPAVD